MEAEEDKIVEHAKEAIHSLTDKKKSWKEKIGSFLWEILIIIIAVNLTIWFHSWSDKRHEQAQVKEFLISTRESLVQDTVSIKFYIKDMTDGPLVYYDSIISQMDKNKIDTQYVDFRIFNLVHTGGIKINDGIYRGFSSANNLRLIENQKLLSDIISLYSISFPSLQEKIKKLFDSRSNSFDKYIGPKIDINSKTGYGKLSTIIFQPEVKYQIQIGELAIREVNQGCKITINTIAIVIQEIDQELKDKFNYDASKLKK